ncbi:MAG: DUF4157 domain-containing protein [Nitrososphaerota archaeon]|nr:DUF4157 domain-containing protein [Nitrososphaerota archaeon]
MSTYEKVKRPDKKADSSSCSSFKVSELLEPQQPNLENGRYAYNFSDLPVNDPTSVVSERSTLIGQLGNSGGGEGLDSKTKNQMENDFGYNFGSVRVHTDNYATNLTSALNAKATCYGQDIYFGKNQFNPNTQEGTNLLKHELTHYQQQTKTGTKKIQNKNETCTPEQNKPSSLIKGIPVIIAGSDSYNDFTDLINDALDEAVSDAEYLRRTANSFTRYSWFLSQVNHGKPWDIKRKSSWNITIGAGTYPGSSCTEFYYNEMIMTPESLGNYTYGYIGAALGIPLLELYIGSFYAAGMPLWGAELQNEHKDQRFIRNGFTAYLFDSL